jgi:hypothetical protein
VVNVHLGRPCRQVDLHVAVGNGHSPDDPAHVMEIASKARVEIVGLGRVWQRKVKLTLIGVQSDQGEGAAVQVAVHPAVNALHEAQVRFPQ